MNDAGTKRVCSCPLNGKRCIDGVRSDFEKDENDRAIPCRWWQHLYGKDPQSPKVIDQWDCAIAWLPITSIEGAQMSRQTAASVDKVANQVAEVKQRLGALGGAVRVAAANISQAVQAGALTVMLPGPAGDSHTNGDHENRELKEEQP